MRVLTAIRRAFSFENIVANGVWLLLLAAFNVLWPTVTRGIAGVSLWYLVPSAVAAFLVLSATLLASQHRPKAPVTAVAEGSIPGVRSDLVITSAMYGIPGKEADVRQRLNELIVDDVLDFFVTNETLGIDPARDEFKSLRVRWTYRGKPDASSYHEGTHIVIPRESARQAEVSPTTKSTKSKPAQTASTVRIEDAARVIRSELRAIVQTTGQYLTGLEKVGPGRTLHYSSGFRFSKEAWESHSSALASNGVLFAVVESAYVEIERANTVIAWRETGAKGLFGVNRDEDDLPALQARAKEAIESLDAFLQREREEPVNVLAVLAPELKADALIAEVQAARSRLVLRGGERRPAAFLGARAFTREARAMAAVKAYVGSYGSPKDGQHLRDVEDLARGERGTDADVLRLDGMIKLLQEMKARGMP